MPNKELSPWRIRFPDDGGLAISLSQMFVQDQIDKYVKLPIQLNSNKIIGIYLNQVPQIIFIEESDRVYSNIVLDASLFSSKIHFPLMFIVHVSLFMIKPMGKLEYLKLKQKTLILMDCHRNI